MVARRDDTAASPPRVAGGGSSSLAARRAAKQRVRREKKQEERARTAASAASRVVAKRDGPERTRPSSPSPRPSSPLTAGGASGDASDDDADPSASAIERKGSFGNYGKTDGRMSVEDDEWATAPRTWAALAPYLLPKFRDKKVWMPFYYDGGAGERLRATGFRKVVHEKRDFFKRINDRVFARAVDVVIDNPPYTGKGMKERVLRALVDADVPFCLLLPLGVLHGAFVREALEVGKVQALVPRRCWVSKKGEREVPFKYLVWLCYGLELERDLVLMPDT